MPRNCPDCGAEMQDDGIHAWCVHCDFSGYVGVQAGKIMRQCSKPNCEGDAIVNLEGEWLCKAHADEWSLGEGIAVSDQENEY